MLNDVCLKLTRFISNGVIIYRACILGGGATVVNQPIKAVELILSPGAETIFKRAADGRRRGPRVTVGEENVVNGDIVALPSDEACGRVRVIHIQHSKWSKSLVRSENEISTNFSLVLH